MLILTAAVMMLVMTDCLRTYCRLVTTAVTTTTTPGVMMVLTLTEVAPPLMTSASVTAV